MLTNNQIDEEARLTALDFRLPATDNVNPLYPLVHHRRFARRIENLVREQTLRDVDGHIRKWKRMAAEATQILG